MKELKKLNDIERMLKIQDREKNFYALDKLFSYLFEIKKNIGLEWNFFIKEAMKHSLNDILLESPQIKHAQAWPRGYMGDAEMIDMIYGMGNAGKKLTEASWTGRLICEHQFNWLGEYAVRMRMFRIAWMIDRLIYKQRNIKIFSVASGHIRELFFSFFFKESQSKFWALDHDKITLRNIQKEFHNYNIEIVHSSVQDILKNNIEEKFNFIYSLGLYDYLKDNIAQRLTLSLFKMLNPDGRILIANFTPATKEMGIMEAFMNWHLIYRNYNDMKKLIKLLPEATKFKIYPEFFNKENRVLYLEIRKDGN